MDRSVAIVGAGWAGCAAAVGLIKAGLRVTLFEAARIPGGRARKVTVEDETLDNGQHILLGAYRRTLQMMREIGIDVEKAFLRLPLQMVYPPAEKAMHLVTPRWFAPWHLVGGLLRATGLDSADRLALARFFTTCRAIRWDIGQDRPVVKMLEQFRQTPKLYALLWRPLCLAALNTSPDTASARTFLAVLRESLGRKRSASDMLIPRMDLSTLFPEKALEYCTRRGAIVRYGLPVRQIGTDGKNWIINNRTDVRFSAVILATPVTVAASLATGLADVSALAAFRPEPITTCYLKYPDTVRLERPFYALLDYPHRQEWGQYVFDRGHVTPRQSGLLSVVISAASLLDGVTREEVGCQTSRQLARCFGQPELKHPLWQHVITEKRATFQSLPGLKRPQNVLDERGLLLAGDYVHPEYPATLEAAVSSGIQAAEILSKRQL